MASQPVLTVDNGALQLPEELLSDSHFQNGTKLQLVSVTDDAISFKRLTVKHVLAAWESLQGILAEEGMDATEWKRREREWELAHDERKFGTPRPQW